MNRIGGNGYGTLTQAAGTVISRVLPARSGAFTRLMKLVYTASTTAHTITLARPIGARVKLSTAASAGQAVVNLTADPGAGISNGIAANDFVVINHDDGVQRLYKVSSVSGLAVTMTTNIAVATSAGKDVWFFGVVGDVDPVLGEAHQTLAAPASATTTYVDDSFDGPGLVSSHTTYQPILVQSNNATAAGSFVQTQYAWTY